MHTQGDCYMASIDDKVTVKLGPRFYLGELLPPATEWDMTVSDSDMCVWVKKGIMDPPATTAEEEGTTTPEASSGGPEWAVGSEAVAMAAGAEVGTAEAAAMTEAYEAAAAETAAEEAAAAEAATAEQDAGEPAVMVMTTEEDPETSQDEGTIEAMKDAYATVRRDFCLNDKKHWGPRQAQALLADTHDVPSSPHTGAVRGGRGGAAGGGAAGGRR